MAIRYNTILDRPYDDQTGRFVRWKQASKSSRFRAELEEYEDFIRIITQPLKAEIPKTHYIEPEPELEEAIEGYDLVEDIIDSYLDVYEIDPEEINDSP